MAVLVTGAAGFIGAATARALLERGDEVVGIDNLNDYYDPALKQARLGQLTTAVRRIASASSGSISPMPRRLKRLADAIERSTASSTSAPRPASATASRTRRPMCSPTSSATATCWSSRGSGGSALRLCLLLLGLRRQQEPAVPGRGPGRSSAVALCRDQEGRRADERKPTPASIGCR